MKNDIAIQVESLGKKYTIGKVGKQLSVLEFFENFSSNIKRKKQEDFWALKDVSFEVKRGDVVGIIGRNGAGKSTLLKILSRITSPTTGQVTLNGRIASLLEVGTGFNAELTGRENIYLNGSILGMTKKEIDGKFADIIEFSGVGKFLDTPVKRYSSGMYVRLAFSVAAHLESEILIVDEVLAVGDVDFQKKCLGKIKNEAKEGRTVLLVSHNMGSITSLCKKAIYLHNGQIEFVGPTKQAISKYLKIPKKIRGLINMSLFDGDLAKRIHIHRIVVNNRVNNIHIYPNEEINVKIYGEALEHLDRYFTSVSIYYESNRLFTMNDYNKKEISKGTFCSEFNIKNQLRPGEYSIAIGGKSNDHNEWMYAEDLVSFTILEKWDHHNLKSNVGIINIEYTNSRTYD